MRHASAVNFVESAVVIDASGDPMATRRFDDFVKEANVSSEPATETQTQIARVA
jgi:ribonuclease VapC